MKKLTIQFWKAEKALAMQILEQEGLPSCKEEGKVLIRNRPALYENSIHLRGCAKWDNLRIPHIEFSTNAELEEYLQKVVNAITDELFTGEGELKVGEMCEASALGECWIGAAKDEKDCAFVVCGTGIGGALVKDKKIHSGVHKHGGEFGYCLVDIDVHNQKYLSWSRAGSTFAVTKFIADRKGISMDNFNGIKAFELYDNGDEIAIEEVNRFFRYMAIGIFNIQYTYDPEVIVLGGAICERKGFCVDSSKI